MLARFQRRHGAPAALGPARVFAAGSWRFAWSGQGDAVTLVASDDRKLLERIYLATLSRRPTASEADIAIRHIQSLGDRAKGFEDVQYALFNLGEFLLRH